MENIITSVLANKNIALLLLLNLAIKSETKRDTSCMSRHHQSLLGYLQMLVFPEEKHRTQGDNLSNNVASYSSITHTYRPLLFR